MTAPQRPDEPLADARDRARATSELGTSFAVEAAAGAGKTTVLVDRLLALVREDKATLGDIVAITFTEKAAGELKVRVRDELEKALERPLDGEIEERFRAALDDLGHAPIGTIHAFCSSLLRERPVEAGVDPQFQVADELAASLLRERTWDEWLEARLAEGSPALLRAVANGLSLEDPQSGLYALALKMLDCRDLAEGRPRPAPGGLTASDFIRFARPKLAVLVDQVQTYCDAEKGEEFRGYMEDAHRTLMLAEGLRTVQAEAAVMRLNFRRRFPGKQGWVRQESRDLAVQIHGELKERHDQVTAAIGADLAASIADALMGYLEAFGRAKDEAGLLDFQDLLLLTRDMLASSRAAREHFKDRYKYLLVDEFQDTDPLQAEIVFFLAERPGRCAAAWEEVELEAGKLFIVGDPKQSIYRFRRADIEIYERAKAALARHGEPLTLFQSFRPVQGLAKVVNNIFREVIKRPADGAYQPDYVELAARRESVSSRPAALLLLPPPEVREGLTDEDASRRAEARCVAAMVQHIVAEGWTIADPRTKEPRPVAYGDIAILARTFTASERYADALAAADVPLRIVGGKHFYLAHEIHSLVLVLKAIDNPKDRLSLVAALRGPFFGVSDDDLLVAACEGGPLGYLDGPRGGTVGEALAVLRDLHERRNAGSLPLLLQRLLERTKALELFCLRPRGVQRVANLLKVVGRARELEATERVTFRGFVRWLSRLHETEADETESALAEGGGDFVQFLTIHRAKGLEFPVVFVADMTYGGSRKSSFVVLRDRAPSEGQFAFYLGSADDGIRTANMPDEAYDKVRSEAEAARLFYVAATRARDLLFLLPHWGKRTSGLAQFLGDGLDPDCPPWGEATSRGLVFDTRELDLGERPGRPFRVPLPEEAPPGTAAKRLAARAKWREAADRRLAAAGEGIVWRSPSRLGEGLVAAAPADEAAGTAEEGRQIGSAVHRALERAGLADAAALDAVARAAARESGLSAEATETARRLVRVAAGSDLVRRARAAGCQHEVPFAVEVGGVVLSGAMDLLFVEDGEAVVVDFKTDAVAGAMPDEEAALARLAARYRPQVLAYALAARRILCKPVKEVILSFLAVGRQWPIQITDDGLAEGLRHVAAGK